MDRNEGGSDHDFVVLEVEVDRVRVGELVSQGNLQGLATCRWRHISFATKQDARGIQVEFTETDCDDRGWGVIEGRVHRPAFDDFHMKVSVEVHLRV